MKFLPPARFPARRRLAWLLAGFACCTHAVATTNFSAWVHPAPGGRLIQQPDALGNRILDYTAVGYQSGAAPLPVVPVRITLSPVAGDDGASIQAALNAVSALPMDANGFRGAVLLNAGEYDLTNSITLSAGGVVLRGVGNDTNGTGTILRAAGPGQRSLVRITGSGSPSTVSGTTHNLTNTCVPVGATSFLVDSTSGLAVGDRVFVRRNANQQWIDDLGMNLLDNPWTPSGYVIDFDRVISRIEGNRIFVNAPITCAIEQRYGGGTIRKYTWTGRIRNVGVENLRGVSDFVAADDEDHGWILVQVNSAEQVWVRDVISQYFGYACVALYNGTRYATVRDCRSLDPVSIVTGGRRYAFVLDDCQLCLVQNCHTDEDRHQFVTQSLTTGPNVFVDGLSDAAKSDCGPHHRWGTGALWDCVTVNGNNLNIQNRGNLGTGHGWAGANEVVWNTDADGGFVVQNPPGARNWLIGSIGAIENGTVYVGPHDPGTYDSHGSNVFPNSLYYAQMQDRLAAPNLQTREYWLGEIDAFTNTSPAGEPVPVDAAWSSAVTAAAGGQPLHGFDLVSNSHWVPFTFNCSLAPNEHVVAARLNLSLRAASSAADDDVLHLDSLTNSFTFASLGWTPISTTTNPTVRVLDLANQLPLLADGELNVAVQNDTGIDWAMLELEVAPNVNAGSFALFPVADATVRGGASASSNFGTAATLTLKEDSSADNDRKAYLRWDLSGVTGIVYQARVRLTAVSVGTNGIEQGAALSTSNAWSETGVTWNNQPGAGKRFATWIPGTNGPTEFVVTPQVLAALAADQQLSLQLYSLRNVGGAGLVDYAAREAADANTRPQLILLVSETPPTVSDITNRSVPVNGSTGPIDFNVSDDKTPAGSIAVNGFSSNTNLVPDVNIVFGGTGSNRTLNVTPAANQSGIAVITVVATDASGLSGSDAFTLTVSSHPPTVFVWNGPGAGANNWSASGNWSPAGPPEALDDLKFHDAGAAGLGVSNVNNFVDAAFGGVIASVQYANTNGNHTTFIDAGKTLMISGGGLVVGTETDHGNAQAVFATITGPAGALELDTPGADFVARQGSAVNGSQRATLDLSGLARFDARLDQLLVGAVGPVIRATGTLRLARTNALLATGSPGVLVGDNSSNAGGQDWIYLGQSNFICADSIAIARQKATATLRFNPAFADSFARFRAADGLGRVTTWAIGDHSLQSSSSSSSIGTNDFSGGTVDALVDAMVLGRSQKTTGAPSLGVLIFTAGTIDVNTLQAGFQAQSDATMGGVGRIHVNGAQASLVVKALLELGHTSGGAGTSNTFGTLAIHDGAVFANSIAVGAGSGPNAISVHNGSLAVNLAIGLPAAPVSRIALTNSTLQLSVAADSTNVVAADLVTGGSGNTILISSLPAIAAYPAQFPLLKYSGAIGGAGFNFVLGGLPPDAGCGGYLLDNAAGGSVDLVITNCIVPDPFLTWDGLSGGDWDTETANWRNNLETGLVYRPGDRVVFNDSAGGTTSINLTGILTPAWITVSNNSRTYTFGDLGKLSGAGGLSKRGGGTLILANAGNNDFTGGVTVESGALRVGDGGANGTLPSGTLLNNASLIFNRSNEVALAAVISGTGTLRQEGAGALTLSGANSYSGATTIAQGTLKPGHAAALGTTNGGTLIAAGATLDVNGLSLGGEPVMVSGSGVSSNGAIVNSGAQITTALRNVILTGDATFGGTGRWDIRNSSGAASLLSAGQPFKITKVGTNQVSLVGVNPIDAALGDIDIRQGVFAIQTSTGQVGDANRTIFVRNGATLNLWALSTTPLNKRIVLENGGAIWNESGSSVIVGTIILTNGTGTMNVGGTSLTLSNGVIAGPGGLVKSGGGTLNLRGVNTWTGGTLISTGTLALVGSGSIGNSATITVAGSGTLEVSGRIDGRLTLNGGQTLNGNGTILGSLQAGVGSMVSPGESIGALTVTNTVTLHGTTFMELNKPANTNDVLEGAALIQYGGTLALTNLSGALAAGDRFTLFHAANYAGAFETLTPVAPGPGLRWDASGLVTNGTLGVVLAPPPVISRVWASGANLLLSGSNGLPGGVYCILSATNLELPLSNWARLTTNFFGTDGSFEWTNTLDEPARFYLLQSQ